MDLAFESQPLRRLCNESVAMTARWGEDGARFVAQALHELDAVETLADLAALPHVDVRADSASEVTVDSAGGVRIVLRSDDDDGAPDRRPLEIRAVVVVRVAVSPGGRRGRGRG